MSLHRFLSSHSVRWNLGSLNCPNTSLFHSHEGGRKVSDAPLEAVRLFTILSCSTHFHLLYIISRSNSCWRKWVRCVHWKSTREWSRNECSLYYGWVIRILLNTQWLLPERNACRRINLIVYFMVGKVNTVSMEGRRNKWGKFNKRMSLFNCHQAHAFYG